ncbi:hypothetical protein HK405_013941 [Cladochytrium tenue]|nr:hypothetical protein HK405_013941 [Cladochytrium tenue]
MAALDARRFDAARGLHDEDAATDALEARIRAVAADLADLADLEAREDARPPDESTGKLAIYTSLGITLVRDPNGVLRRCHVQSHESNDIAPVDFDDPKCSRFYYANLIWDLCSS